MLRACEQPPPLDEQLFEATHDHDEWAARWVYSRVASLGWTPQRFGEFDARHGHGLGNRETHKPERIGKKYQWMASTNSSNANIANHYHPNGHFLGGSTVYTGAWQAGLRELDPTLPPADHPIIADEEDVSDKDERTPTFKCTPIGFWVPPPVLPTREGVKDWITTGPSPTLREITAVRTDEHNTPWVVLGEYAIDTADGLGWSKPAGQAEQWHIISSWLVLHRQLPDVSEFLAARILIPVGCPPNASRIRSISPSSPTPPQRNVK